MTKAGIETQTYKS